VGYHGDGDTVIQAVCVLLNKIPPESSPKKEEGSGGNYRLFESAVTRDRKHKAVIIVVWATGKLLE
jgi:hypothetical protein